jgi:hypothetical protein
MAGIDLSGYGDIFGSSIPDVSGEFDYSVPTFSGFTSGDFGGANFDSGTNWINQYSPDLSSNYDWNFAPTNRIETDQGYFMPQDYSVMNMPANMPTDGSGDSSFLGSMWDKYAAMPFDKQVGMGMGVLSGLGSAAQMMQQNKLARKARKANEKMSAYQIAAMQRQQKNAAINDRLNNSYDTTTAATVDYNPLTREQAMTYGETGAPHQQLTITPGVTTRNYLADGGMPTRNDALELNGEPNFLNFLGYLAHGKTLPSERHDPNETFLMSLVRGKKVAKDLDTKTRTDKALDEAMGYANGGQADNIHAMLSEGEFVIPADVVSALGDGNTKAGASALHQMMQNVRKTARSGTIDKIPPKVKTPMSYIKKGKK